MGVLFGSAQADVLVVGPFWNGLSELHKTLIRLYFLIDKYLTFVVWYIIATFS